LFAQPAAPRSNSRIGRIIAGSPRKRPWQPTLSRGFCRAMLEERSSLESIKAVADRLVVEQEEAEALAAQLNNAGLVRVGGGHSV
jgi:hypothetical protein